MLRLSIRVMRTMRCSVNGVNGPSRIAPLAVLHVGSSFNVRPTINLSYSIYRDRWSLSRTLSTCSATADAADADKPTGSQRIQHVSSARLAQLLKLRLPSYCSGCGVKLQQEDADGPG